MKSWWTEVDIVLWIYSILWIGRWLLRLWEYRFVISSSFYYNYDSRFSYSSRYSSTIYFPSIYNTSFSYLSGASFSFYLFPSNITNSYFFSKLKPSRTILLKTSSSFYDSTVKYFLVFSILFTLFSWIFISCISFGCLTPLEEILFNSLNSVESSCKQIKV